MFNSLMTVYAAGKAMGVPVALLVAICTQESGLKNVTVENDGGTPSIGICQIKLQTAQIIRNKYKIKKRISEKDLENPRINAYWAALYLKSKLEDYNNNWCMAVPAYNAGTFIEDRKYPGSPVNYSYVKKVREHLPDDLKDTLNCPRKRKIKHK